MQYGLIYHHLSKALDTVSYKGLLVKMQIMALVKNFKANKELMKDVTNGQAERGNY